jgi:hypothetical protein
MYEIQIPLIRGFKLVCLREDRIFSRLNPIELERAENKVKRYFIASERRKHVVIHDLAWGKYSLFDGIAILHFNEILQSFLHGHLEQNKEYKILSKDYNNGLGIELICNKGVFLKMECSDEDGNRCYVGKFNKLECRLLSRLLHYYLAKYELKEDCFDGHIIGFYGVKRFTLEEENL